MSMMFQHPDLPFCLEAKGHKIIRHYPSGATEPGTPEDWFLAQLIVRLDRLIEDKAKNPTPTDIESALKQVDSIVTDEEQKQSKSKVKSKNESQTKG